MITIQEGLKDGDRVYAWYSPINEKTKNKKSQEHEYIYREYLKDHLKLVMDDGTTWMVLDKNLLDNWWGNVRKA